MLPRKAPLAKAHNSVKEHATKILGTILGGEVQQGWVFLCTEEAQDTLGTYTSPLAAAPKHNLDGTVSKKVLIIHDLSSGKKFVRWAQTADPLEGGVYSASFSSGWWQIRKAKWTETVLTLDIVE